MKVKSFSMACISPTKCMVNCESEKETPHYCCQCHSELHNLLKQLQVQKCTGDHLQGSLNLEFMSKKCFYGPQMNSRKNRAAVLICLFHGEEGELHVILTKRSMKLSSHPGEVALPGGKMDEGDADDSATALREATEEIGLDPCLVQVLAILKPLISLHLLTVVPVVGLLSRVTEYEPVLNANEVDAIFYVPLEMFLKEDSHRCVEKEWRDWKYVCHIYEFEVGPRNFSHRGINCKYSNSGCLHYISTPSNFRRKSTRFQSIAMGTEFSRIVNLLLVTDYVI
ncbi:Nudix hydrolase 15 [Abeliophyllum distichum]|uniref:Nudix hydrolase 15 n=1 Tax=Abeliophyllum distichum TaxID=126358 RepID=A0ABD1VVY8_9LAMI